MVTWISGNSGSGKSTLARRLGGIVLDGDALRKVWPGLGFSQEDRCEHNLRAARLARMLSDQGLDIVVALICPYRELRRVVHEITGCRFIYLPGGRTGDPEYPYEWPGEDGF